MHLKLPLEIYELSIYDSYAIYEFTHLRFYAPGVHVHVHLLFVNFANCLCFIIIILVSLYAPILITRLFIYLDFTYIYMYYLLKLLRVHTNRFLRRTMCFIHTYHFSLQLRLWWHNDNILIQHRVWVVSISSCVGIRSITREMLDLTWMCQTMLPSLLIDLSLNRKNNMAIGYHSTSHGF